MKKLMTCFLLCSMLFGCSTKEKEVSNVVKKSEKEIYGEFSKQASWAVNPEIVQNLLDHTDRVVKVKVLEKHDAIFINEIINDHPFTPYQVEVQEVISGEYSGDHTIYVDDGEVLISEAIKALPFESVDKMGLTKLSKQEQESQYIRYTSPWGHSLEVGNEYVLILNKENNGMYTVFTNGYGVFVEEKQGGSTTKPTYSNVITGKIL